MSYQKFREVKNNKQLLADVDTLGAFDFYTSIITLDSLIPEDIERSRAAAGAGALLPPYSLENRLSGDQYSFLVKVLPLAIHEYTHFVDSTSTLWGLTHLMMMNRGYSSNPVFGGKEQDFQYAKAFYDHCRRIRLPKYYTTVNIGSDDSRPWKSSISAGYLFDSKGRSTVNPILFSRFENQGGIGIVRSPVSTVSLLEASAMAQEVFCHLSLILATEDDFKLVEQKCYSKSTVDYLYKKEITEYSVCAHVLANKQGIADVFEAFRLCAAIIRIVLNFSPEAFRRIARRCPIQELLQTNNIEGFTGRMREGLKSGDIGTLFYLICLALPTRTYATADDVMNGVSEALRQLGIEYSTFIKLRDKRADELLAELELSNFQSIRQLSKAGYQNMKLIDQTVAVGFQTLNLPPSWLKDGSVTQIFGHDGNSLKCFNLNQCFDELFEGESWVERFSEGCL